MIAFSKMQATGNDFVIINTLNQKILYTYSKFSEFLCNRHFGVGADGTIFIENSKIADCKMRIFNKDGTEAEMCGNGIRCLAKYLYEKEVIKKTNLKIETLAGIKEINLIIENKTVIVVKVDMGEALFEYSKIPVIFPNVVQKEIEKLEIKIENDIFIGYPISIGNPHFVCFIDDLESLDINKIGPIIENYKYFPNRTNIEFVEIKSYKNIKMRVWERGVGETLGCGTGACASAVISYMQNLTKNEVMVELPGGKLKVIYLKNDNKILLIGDSYFVFDGKLK